MSSRKEYDEYDYHNEAAGRRMPAGACRTRSARQRCASMRA